MKKWTDISLAAFNALFYEYEPSNEIVRSNYSINSIITILKLNAGMEEFNQEFVLAFLKSIILINKTEEEIQTELIKIKNAWNLIIITEQMKQIFENYIDIYDEVANFNRKLAFNLFIYNIPIEVIFKNDAYAIILKLSEYEFLTLESAVSKQDSRFFNDFNAIHSSLTPLGKRFLIKTLLEGTNIMIRWVCK